MQVVKISRQQNVIHVVARKFYEPVSLGWSLAEKFHGETGWRTTTAANMEVLSVCTSVTTWCAQIIQQKTVDNRLHIASTKHMTEWLGPWHLTWAAAKNHLCWQCFKYSLYTPSMAPGKLTCKIDINLGPCRFHMLRNETKSEQDQFWNKNFLTSSPAVLTVLVMMHKFSLAALPHDEFILQFTSK